MMSLVPFYFYLSFARSDAGLHTDYVKRFFDDLSDFIRIKLRLPHGEPVGFLDRRESRTSDWAGQLAQATPGYDAGPKTDSHQCPTLKAASVVP